MGQGCRREYDAVMTPKSRGGGKLRRRASFTSTQSSVVDVGLGFADFPLALALQFLGLALELLAAVSGQAANRVPDLAFRFLCNALDLVFEAIAIEIVSHLEIPR